MNLTLKTWNQNNLSDIFKEDMRKMTYLMALVATHAWYFWSTAYVNFRIPFGKRWFLHFTEKETEAEGWRACPTVTGGVTRPAGIRILEFCLPASCWAHWTRNSHTSAVTRSVNIQCFQDSAKKISFFMKMNSVHPNLICIPCFPWSSLFVLSFTFSFHFLYAPESFFFFNSFFLFPPFSTCC